MPTLDEVIAQNLQDSLASGELQHCPAWGKPLPEDEGYEQTPIELRLPFKVMKQAGFVPTEVLMLREVAELERRIAACTDPVQAEALRQQKTDLALLAALRMERLRRTGTL